MTTSNRLASAALAFALCLSSLPTFAQQGQPSASDLESARELYKEGKELRSKGDLRGALEKFKQAHAYGQTPVTALELGKTHMQLGELVEAREVFLSVGRMKVQPDETDKSADARKEAADLAEQLRPKIPTLSIKITGATSDSSVELKVDGAVVPVVSMVATRKTNPGPHSVTARVGNREGKADVDLAEGDTKEIAIAIPDTDNAAAVGGPPPPGGETTKHGKDIHVVTWVGAGLAVAGLGVGTVAGVIALSKSSTVKKECSGLSCPSTAKADVDSGRKVATISTIGFIAGGVGMVTAAVGYFLLSTPASASADGVHVRAVAGPTWVGLDGKF